jgi:hypothetical protein
MRPLLFCLLSLSSMVHAAPAPAPPASAPQAAAPAPALPLRARLDKDAIRAAIDATPAGKAPVPGPEQADTLSASPYAHFSKQFTDARVPDCLHPDGLKRQPTFFLGGLLAVPFVAVAKLRGVCR